MLFGWKCVKTVCAESSQVQAVSNGQPMGCRLQPTPRPSWALHSKVQFFERNHAASVPVGLASQGNSVHMPAGSQDWTYLRWSSSFPSGNQMWEWNIRPFSDDFSIQISMCRLGECWDLVLWRLLRVPLRRIATSWHQSHPEPPSVARRPVHCNGVNTQE